MSMREDVIYSYNRLCHSTTSNTPFSLSIKELMANGQKNSILLTINDSSSDLEIERIEEVENISLDILEFIEE